MVLGEQTALTTRKHETERANKNACKSDGARLIKEGRELAAHTYTHKHGEKHPGEDEKWCKRFVLIYESCEKYEEPVVSYTAYLLHHIVRISSH